MIEDPRIEYSEDRRRGEKEHIRAAIRNVGALGSLSRQSSAARCSRCRTRAATHLIDAYNRPRAVCGICAGHWASLTPLERRQARTDFTRRGGR